VCVCVCVCAGDKDATDRRGAVRTLLAAATAL